MTTASNGPDVAIVGGAVAGLAAAERFSEFAGRVDLYERMSYDEDRIVNCGEAFTTPELVPLARTPENGFLNRCSRFVVRVHPDPKYGFEDRVSGETTLSSGEAYVCDRRVVENVWADRLGDLGVTVHAGTTVSSAQFDDLTDEYDVVVDASGNPSWGARALGFSNEYTGSMVALNADVTGDLSAFYPEPHVIHEGTRGYFWVFPKTDDRANVGIGWELGYQPPDYYEALWRACDRHGVPRPGRGDVYAYTIPAGPALDVEHVHHRLDGADVYLVGDAAGTANRYQGEGITQAIRSSYLLGDLVRSGRGHEYPGRLYDAMVDEYRLATFMKGLWDAFEDPDLLAEAIDAVGGLSIEEVTREPRKVYAAIARRPRLAFRIARNAEMWSRAFRAYGGRWEYV